jgi:hypothetical protein
MGREAWILGVLLLVFVTATTLYTQRGFETEQRQQPSTYSTSSKGTRALFDLLQRQGVRVQRGERPLTELTEEVGLLVIVEPLARAIDGTETAALQEWLNGGGTLLLVVSGSWPLRSAFGVGFEEMSVRPTDAPPSDVRTVPGESPFLQDVASLRVVTPTRLAPTPGKKGVTRLAHNADGALALTWKEKEGRVVAVSDGVSLDNRSIASADNAVFYVNVAQEAARGDRPIVLFDEYHQGYGEETGTQKSLWQAIGTPGRALFFYLLAAFLLVVYNANRRFGAPLTVELPSSRPSTEYITSMALLYRRAGAGEIALETIYKDFVRDLASKVDAPPEADSQRLAELAERRFGISAGGLRDLLVRCEQAVTAGEAGESVSRSGKRLPDAELLRLARQIQDYRRKAGLVRLS